MILLRPFLVALGFLTILPAPVSGVSERDLGRSLAFFPLVGLLLGGLLVGAARLAGPWIPSSVLAWALTAGLVILTGGLHLDGLADVFDGIGGSRGNRDRMLEIMRDSRIGAHGAASLVLLLLGKVVGLHALLTRGDPGMLWALPVAPRYAAVCLVALFPCARQEGLGKLFAGSRPRGALLAATLVTVAVVASVGRGAVVPSLAAASAAIALGFWLGRRLGGLTGDAYGAAIELGELAFLLACFSEH